MAGHGLGVDEEVLDAHDTRHVEQFRDLEGQVNLGDNELTIDLFRGSLTRSIQEKFERNPPKELWEWFREVEEIDRQRMLLQQASARHSQANNASLPGTRPIQSSIPIRRSAAQPNSARSPVQPYQSSQPYPARQPLQHLPHSNNRPLPHQPTPALKGTPAPSGGSNNTCHVCKGIRHWARDCPSRRVDSLGSRPMGPKVMVVTKDPFEETTGSGDGHSGNTELEQEDMDLRPYQQHMGSDNEDEQDDDDKEGNYASPSGGKAVLELSGTVQDHPARILADTGAGFSASMQVSIGTHNLGVVEASVADTADYDLILGFTKLQRLKPTIQWDTGQLGFKAQEQDRPPKRPPEAAGAKALSIKSPTLHGNEFVSAERILQAALEDGPIGFMLLEVSPSSLPAFGFVPTGADKGVEMEVEVDMEVTAADIPKPYQHLRDVFDEVEADKLPHHTEHDLHLELVEGKGVHKAIEEPGMITSALCTKEGWRSQTLCGLNEITVKNRAPLPLIEEQLFLLRKARIYTKLDLRAAYNLIRIAKGDEWKTAFGTQLGLYEYLVMLFGLANAPAHFQSFINDIFRDIIGVYVVVYLDDFLIFSDTEESHVKHVTKVLTCLRSNRLFAKLSKCEFHTKTVEFYHEPALRLAMTARARSRGGQRRLPDFGRSG
ncbi:related to retrotransposon nucleocapsid protein [Ustilago sp. UG-2017b]|nr:related to retrotransposon nucleocapsid protein [Ustilago sp. UG-2017b]